MNKYGTYLVVFLLAASPLRMKIMAENTTKDAVNTDTQTCKTRKQESLMFLLSFF